MERTVTSEAPVGSGADVSRSAPLPATSYHRTLIRNGMGVFTPHSPPDEAGAAATSLSGP